MRKLFKTLLINLFIGLSGHSIGYDIITSQAEGNNVRPIIKQALDSCQRSYFDAINPTRIEVTYLLENLMGKIIFLHEDSIKSLASIEKNDEIFSKTPSGNTAYINGLRKNQIEYLSNILIKRNTCLQLFKSINGTQTDYDLLITKLGRSHKFSFNPDMGYALSPYLLNELTTKGGAIYRQYTKSESINILNKIKMKCPLILLRLETFKPWVASLPVNSSQSY